MKWFEPFVQTALELVAGLAAEGLAEPYVAPSTHDAPPVHLLVSPGAFDAGRVILVVSGVPEEAGVWSYTLLSQGRVEESSMRPYFAMARRRGWGVVALNPHHGRETEGEAREYWAGLDATLSALFRGERRPRVVCICFSAGGSLLFSYLVERDTLAEKLARVVLIDTAPPPVARREFGPGTTALLGRSVLFGQTAEGRTMSPMARASSAVLGLAPVAVRASLHGELPGLLIGEVEEILRSEEHPRMT